jgi:hypothetical protein
VDVDPVERGPEMRFWYLVTIEDEHVQGLSESP